MANDKKFIVKNGLQSKDGRVVIGTDVDDGSNQLQITGTSKATGQVTVTQSSQVTPSLKVENSGGPSSIVARFEGDAESLDIVNFTAGDYAITNTGVGNGIRFYNDATAGVEIMYNNTVDLDFTSTGIDFKREPRYLGSVFWNAGNDGAGSGLDADLLDGLDSLQFVRSDQDDTMSGNYIITGNLTVQGTTTTVESETVLIADNLLTLNSNFTSGTPTENAGWEVLRGSLATSSLQWDETNDWFKLISAGTDLGRIITTADEGSGNLFDADTVDGLEAAQFLRSDADDTATGNITIEGNLTVGDGNGTSFIYMDGAGTNGIIASTNGETGILNSSANFAIKVKTNGDVEVRDDILAQRFIDKDATTYFVHPGDESVLNNVNLVGQLRRDGNTTTHIEFPADNQIGFGISGAQAGIMTSGYFQYNGDIRADRFVDKQDTNYFVNPSDESVIHSLGIDDDIFHNGDTDNKISFGTDTQTFQTGGATRLTIADGSVTSAVDVIGPRFLDSADNGYYGDFAGTSIINNISLEGSISHNGDADTSITFPAADQFGITVGGTAKVNINTTSSDFVGLVTADDLDVYSGATTADINVGRSVNERINLHVTDGQGYLRYYQDEVDSTDHSFNFEIQSSGSYPSKFKFNKDVALGANNLEAGIGIFGTAVYAPVYYDSDVTHYGDFGNTGTSLYFAGQSQGGNGTSALPTYSFISDPNTGMFRGAADRLDFSAGGNVELQVTTTYTQAPGEFRAPLFRDSDSTGYYGDFAGTSVMNNIDLEGSIRHNGDTNTYINFPAADTFAVVTGGTGRLSIDTDSADFSVNVYAPRYYDSNNNIYYGDFAATSIMSRIDLDDYIRHRGDENTYFGFETNDTFRVFTNGTQRFNLDGDSADFAQNVFAPRYHTNDYLVHTGDLDTYIGFDNADTFSVYTGGTERLLINNTNAEFYVDIGIDDYISHNGDPNTYFGFDANDNFGVWTSGNKQLEVNSTGQVGIGGSPVATLSVNKTTVQTNNPFSAGSELLTLGDMGTVDLSIRTDATGNIYYVNDNGGNHIWYDTNATGKFAVLNDGSVIANGDSMTYTATDAVSSLSRTFSANKFNVTGGAHLAQRDDVYSIYQADGGEATVNEATFLAVNELGFSAGGGFYMDDVNTVKVRGNKNIYTTGDMYAARFYDSGNDSYYVDPAGTSTMNRIDIDDYIRHNADNNTYFGFSANDTYVVNTNGTNKLSIDTDSADFSVNVYAPRYYDSDDGNYYLDPNGDSQLNTVDIDDYIRHRGNTNTYIGFPGNNIIRAFVAGNQVMNLDGNSADFAQNVYAPAYYDSNDTFYYTNPAVFSRMNGITFGNPGNGNNTKGRWLSIEGNTDSGGEGSARIFFAEHNSTTASMDRYGMSLAYMGGSNQVSSASGQPVTLNGLSNGTWGLIGHDNSVNGSWAMRGPRSGDYVEARGSFRAPIFYDSNDTAWYLDPASTSNLNVVRARQYQMDVAGRYIDSPSGEYGTIKVEGETGGWAGYAIRDDWVFMSNGTTNMGLYNDTRNEWSLYAQDNNFTRLYSNGVHQIGAENGYGLAPNNMRAPIFYDYDDAAYFGDFNSRSRMQTLSLGNQGDLSANNTYALRLWHNNRYLMGMRSTSGGSNYPWLVHDNYNFNQVGSVDAFIVHFNGLGDRLYLTEQGNMLITGEMAASNYNLNAGNENISLNPSYGAGTSEPKLFDGNTYWEKRAIQALQGAEDSPTTTTSEYVKSTNAPASSSYVLRSSGYRTFYSDYITVEPGEEVYGEMWVRYISGSGGLFYYGIERFDKDKKPIAGNTGTTYFVAGGNNVTSGSWTKFSGHTTIPTTHTVYNGSDGQGCRYVRIRILMNYSTGGALREFTAPILVRTNTQSRIRTDQAVYSPIYYDSNDTNYYLDPASTSKLNTVDASNFRDRDNTARFMNPNSGGNVQGTWNWNNGSITNLNNLTFNDPGANEGIKWEGGNLWQIYESPDNQTNAGGNLQFTSGSGSGTRRMWMNTSGDVYAQRYFRAQRFYDSNDGSYYADPASTSVFNKLHVGAGTGTSFSDGGDPDISTRTIFSTSKVVTPRLVFLNDGNGDDNYIQHSDNNGAYTATGRQFGAWFTFHGDKIDPDSTNSGAIVVSGIRSRYIEGRNEIRSPIFYDNNDTNYYGDFASTSRMNTIIANMYSLDNGWDIYDDDSDTMSIRSNNGDHGEIIFRDSGGTGCGRIYFDDDNHWGLKSPDNEWQLYMERNARVYIYYNGTWEERTASGYMEARGSYRAPIFYDSNDTGFYANPNATSRFRRLTVLEAITAPGVEGYANTLVRRDNRTIEPNDDPSGQLRFGFTSWANNNTSPWADYLHLRSYTDASGGSDNLLVFKKSGHGMRLFQQSWNSGTVYSNYRNVALYDVNPDGSGNDLYAATYYDEDDTGRYMNPAGTSNINQLRINGGNELRFYTSSGNLRGYIQATETNDAHLKIATSGGEDIAFYDGGLSGQRNFLIRGDGNTFTTGTHYAQRFTDSNNGNYYGDFASTSVTNTIDNRGEIYNDGWFRNDTNGRGLYNTATAMHWYSTSTERWRAYSTANVVSIDMHTSGNNRRGRFYANNSNQIGILSQDDGWALRCTNSEVRSYHNFYAPIMYDTNSTSYYMDPNGTSRLNNVRANYFTNDGSVSSNDSFGLYWDSGRSTAYAIYREAGGWSYRYPDLRIAFHTGIKMGANASYNGMRFYNDYNMAGQVMSINNATDPLGGNNVYVNNNLQAGSSLRAPIFYDSNNTAYYFNGASSHSTRFEGVNNRTMAYINQPGHTRNSGEYYRARPRITGDTNYWTGAMGWGRQDMNVVSTWGSGFIDSWSNPANQPSGTSHWVGCQAFHYRNSNTSGYGWQMVGGPIENLRFRSSWSGWRSWRTIPVLGVNSTNAAAMYASIYYDANNTGYYCDPSSSSNFNSYVRANEFYARNWFRNDNQDEGLYNQNTGAHFYSDTGQYWSMTGNNNNSSISVRLRSTYEGTTRLWLYGSGAWGGFLNRPGSWKFRYRVEDGYSPAWRFEESGDESWTGNVGNDVGKIEYHSNRFYIEAGGNSNRIVQFRRNGSNKSYVNNDGIYVGTATSARWADLAERYTADDIYEHGTLMGIDLDGDAEITIWREGLPMVGVISTKPGVKMNDMGIENMKSKKSKRNPYIALKGRIPALVSGEDGAVKKGMWLIPDPEAVGKCKGVLYGTPGINSHEIIGIALCDSKDGEVEVKV